MHQRDLSDFERGMIVGLHLAGKSGRDIEKILKVGKSTANRVISAYHESEKTTTAPRTGRPPILDEQSTRQLVRTVKKNRKAAVEEITHEFASGLNISVSKRTVQRVLHKEGFYARVGVRKPFVSETNRTRRLKWSEERKSWTDEWNSVIWSDESRYLIFQNDSRQWVWRRPHEKYDVDCLIPTVKSGNAGVMVWGCFTRNMIGPLIIVEGRLNAESYKNLLESHLLPFYESLNGDLPYFFQDDNAPCHRAHSVASWKEENMINCLLWPAQSPDLNPIEHLWDVLERQVRARNPHPKNKDELALALTEEWLNIDQTILENLVDSMPRRVDAVIKSRGYPTKY